VTQPFFTPVPQSGEVRSTMNTETPEIGRTPKAGLQRRMSDAAFSGTPAPDAGYALTLAHHACADLHAPAGVSHHDVEVGVALLASALASQAHRGPTMKDVRGVVSSLGLEQASSDAWPHFAGVSHSYAAQRRLVDDVASRVATERSRH